MVPRAPHAYHTVGAGYMLCYLHFQDLVPEATGSKDMESLQSVPECALLQKSFGCSLQGFPCDSTLSTQQYLVPCLRKGKKIPASQGVFEEVLPLSTCGCCIVLPWAVLTSG